MKFFNKEVQIALVAIAGVVILFFGLQFLKGLNMFSNEDKYYVTFDDISGLTPSSSVYADGFKVGVVKNIIYNYGNGGKIIAEIGLDKNMRMPKGTSAQIVSDMLGNVKVNILLASNPLERVEVGDTISGSQEEGMLAKVGGMVPAVEKMLPKLDSIMTSLNTLLADPALAKSLHNVEDITTNLAVTSSQLNVMMTGLNKNMPILMSKANSVLDNANTITSNLSDVDVQTTMNKVNATLDNVEQMTAKLNSNEGTLGLLMRDPSLYLNLNSTMQHADSLMIDLRQHPKRYVHFSVFGKKDK